MAAEPSAASRGRLPSARAAALAALVLFALATSVQADDTGGWTVRTAMQLALGSPIGGFDLPGSSSSVGASLAVAASPPRSPFAIRLDLGALAHSEGAPPDSTNFFGTVQIQNVTVSNDSYWLAVGAQWDPRPRDTGAYLYATVGALRFDAQAHAEVGQFFSSDVPGDPPASTRVLGCLGAGGRLVFGTQRRYALALEVEVRRSGDVDAIGPPGVEGVYPNQRVSSRHGPLEMLVARLGFARGPRPARASTSPH
jgi:hypothetical protein